MNPELDPDSVQRRQIAGFYDRWAHRRKRFARLGRYYLTELACFYRHNIPLGSKVLEAGCGTGDLLAEVASAGRGWGIDLSPRMVEAARLRHPDLHFETMDAGRIDLAERFDAVIASDLVGDLVDVQEFFASVRNVLAPRGRLLVDFYNPLWEGVFQAAAFLGLRMPRPVQNWLPFGALAAIARLEGFEVVRATRAILVPVWIPGLSALLNHFAAKLPGLTRLCLLHRMILRPVPAPGTGGPAPSVTVLVPCRNEKGNMEPLFERLPAMGSRTELLFVDGNSTDGTVEEIERLAGKSWPFQVRVLAQDGAKGKGDAVRQGFGEAQGDILMILDADLTVIPEDLPKFYEAIASGGGEFVNGTRRVYPMEGDAMRLVNRCGNWFFSAVFCWILDQRVTDTLCGTKVLWSDDWRRICVLRATEFGDADPFGDFDLIFGATRLNLKILEIPIRYRARTYGTTKIRRFYHGAMLLKMCAVGFWRLKRI